MRARKLKLDWWVDPDLRGFNGAAPVRARKCNTRSMPHLPPPCFNGAAPVRARKCRNAMKDWQAAARLQRGRACEGAEMG